MHLQVLSYVLDLRVTPCDSASHPYVVTATFFFFFLFFGFFNFFGFSSFF